VAVLYYDYDLMDSVYVGDHYCYHDWISGPKSPQDIAFYGKSMWINKGGMGPKSRSTLRGEDRPTYNFVEKIKSTTGVGNQRKGAHWLA
jgi:hypothetical protein